MSRSLAAELTASLRRLVIHPGSPNRRQYGTALQPKLYMQVWPPLSVIHCVDDSTAPFRDITARPRLPRRCAELCRRNTFWNFDALLVRHRKIRPSWARLQLLLPLPLRLCRRCGEYHLTYDFDISRWPRQGVARLTPGTNTTRSNSHSTCLLWRMACL